MLYMADALNDETLCKERMMHCMVHFGILSGIISPYFIKMK